MVERRLIDKNVLLDFLTDWKNDDQYKMHSVGRWVRTNGIRTLMTVVNQIDTVDAVEVVRCKDCQHGVFDAGKGVWKCVESAEWDGVMGDWVGFVVYRPNDFYCADGERRSE